MATLLIPPSIDGKLPTFSPEALIALLYVSYNGTPLSELKINTSTTLTSPLLTTDNGKKAYRTLSSIQRYLPRSSCRGNKPVGSSPETGALETYIQHAFYPLAIYLQRVNTREYESCFRPQLAHAVGFPGNYLLPSLLHRQGMVICEEAGLTAPSNASPGEGPERNALGFIKRVMPSATVGEDEINAVGNDSETRFDKSIGEVGFRVMTYTRKVLGVVESLLNVGDVVLENDERLKAALMGYLFYIMQPFDSPIYRAGQATTTVGASVSILIKKEFPKVFSIWQEYSADASARLDALEIEPVKGDWKDLVFLWTHFYLV